MSDTRTRPHVADIGFSTIAEPATATADLVFVHGLQGHPEKTWTYQSAQTVSKKKHWFNKSRTKSGNLPDNIFWPLHFLSKHPALKKTRILTWGYDSHVTKFFSPNNQQNISRHGNDLMVALEQERKNDPLRPLIFIAHSLGGILVKSALDNSRRSQHQPRYLRVYQSTKGIVFIGTPHRGSGSTDWALLVSNLAKFALQGTNESVLRALSPNSELLENLHHAFLQILEDGRFHIHSFYETKSMTGLYGLQGLVVPHHSATVGHVKYETVWSINGNHSEICKFAEETDAGYRALLGVIEDSLKVAAEEEVAFISTERKATDLQRTLAVIDQSINLSSLKATNHSSENACYLIPYPKNERFVGRADILKLISEELIPNSSAPPRLRSFALHGMPGVGKTQTALQFVYNNMRTFTSIFWISASSEEKILQGYVEIAKLLGLTKGITSPGSLESLDAGKQWLRNTSSPWLLVFDNVDELRILNPYWPVANLGSVLITSQNPACEFALAHRGAKVEPFTATESVYFLYEFLRPYSGPLDEESATYIAEALGYHPLALNQTASFILESNCSIPSFLEMFTEREEAHKLLNVGYESPWYNYTVEAAFDLSISRLNEDTRRTLEVLSFFDPDSIPEDLLAASVTQQPPSPLFFTALDRNVLIKDLRRFSLINKNLEKQTLSIHRLVQDVAFRQFETDNDRRQFPFETALQLLRNAFPLHSLSRDHMTEIWPQCERYLPHVLAFHENYKRLVGKGGVNISSGFIELIYSCAWYLCERGRFEVSNSLIKTAKAEYERTSLQDHGLLWADICTVQLFEHNEMSKMKEAEDMAYTAHRIREDAVLAGFLDEYHPNRANGFMNLGVVVANREANEAIQLHTSALNIRHGSNKYAKDQIHGLSLNYLNIGRCFWMTGKLEKAEESFETCLAIIKEREDICGHRSMVAWALWALGNIFIDKRDFENALKLHTQSMMLTTEILGSSHLKTAACFHKVAWLLHKRKEFDRAITLLELALDVYEKRSIDVRAEKARTKYKLAQVLKDANYMPRSRWQALEADAYRLREEITGMTSDTMVSETCFDELVAYFYR